MLKKKHIAGLVIILVAIILIIIVYLVFEKKIAALEEQKFE